jgi:iron complex transport system substrate-binding protein
MAEKRVVSLIASATEIVAALGCERWLVGRSHECDYPTSVTALPACTGPKFAVEGTAYAIDQRVKAIVQEGLSVYRVFAETLEALRPDVIVTQSQCEVCAVSLKDVEDAVCRMVSSRPRIVSLEPNSLVDIWRDILRVAEALERPGRGVALVAELSERMDAVAHEARKTGTRPTVACIEWIEPLMAAGNWMPELVAMAGGENLFGDPGKHSPWMTWEDLVAADPEVIVFLPCGWDIERTREDLPVLSEKSDWPGLKAVQTGRVYLTDGNQFFNRPGPRIAESLEILGEILHPEWFAFGHRGRGWMPA